MWFCKVSISSRQGKPSSGFTSHLSHSTIYQTQAYFLYITGVQRCRQSQRSKADGSKVCVKICIMLWQWRQIEFSSKMSHTGWRHISEMLTFWTEFKFWFSFLINIFKRPKLQEQCAWCQSDNFPHLTTSLETDGTTETCSCFYEERMTGKQRAAQTVKAGLLIAMLPEKQERMFIMIRLDAMGLSSHISPLGGNNTNMEVHCIYIFKSRYLKTT